MTAAAETTRKARDRWTVRRAVAGDAEALAAMLGEMSRELAVTAAARCDAETLRRHGFGEAPLFRAVLGEREARPLGLALYFPEFSTFRGEPGVYVQDLYARPEARATGLARELLAAAARDATETWGASYLRLCAHETNPRALRFYDRLGFETDLGERPHWIEGARFARLGGLR